MNQSTSVYLRRDGPHSPWGFRLQGGCDVGWPLTVQRVCFGTPSEGELRRGDVLLRIGDRDATRLTHQEAHDIIKSAGNHLALVVHRVAGAPQSPVSSPLPYGHQPLSNVTRLSDNSSYKPKTNFVETFRPFVPEPQLLAAAERQEFLDEKRREKQAIVHQAYRTLPLIGPKAKTKHDLPTGSYLRHVHDPNWKTTHPGATAVTNYAVMNKVREAVTAVHSNPGFMISNVDSVPSPDGPKFFHRQYNSPINMYSPQNVVETLHTQTGLQPCIRRESLRDALQELVLTVAPIISESSGIGRQRAPTVPSRKMHNVADITLSPTFQMIHNEEWRDLKSTELKEHRPVQNRLYVAPVAVDGSVNALGVPKGKIQQSGTFNTLRTSLVLSDH